MKIGAKISVHPLQRLDDLLHKISETFFAEPFWFPHARQLVMRFPIQKKTYNSVDNNLSL